MEDGLWMSFLNYRGCSYFRLIHLFETIKVIFGANKKLKLSMHYYFIVMSMMHIAHQLLHGSSFIASHVVVAMCPKHLELL